MAWCQRGLSSWNRIVDVDCLLLSRSRRNLSFRSLAPCLRSNLAPPLPYSRLLSQIQRASWSKQLPKHRRTTHREVAGCGVIGIATGQHCRDSGGVEVEGGWPICVFFFCVCVYRAVERAAAFHEVSNFHYSELPLKNRYFPSI